MRIGIIGCGWLGMPLAQTFVKQGHIVTGTKRTSEGALSLGQYGINGLVMDLRQPMPPADAELLFGNDVLIINIPFGRRQSNEGDFVEHMQRLISYAHRSSHNHVLFISTTSVYGDDAGKVTETSNCAPQSLSASVNYDIEQYLSDSFGHRATILRLAGLVGAERHPVKHLAGKKGLAHARRRVNLVHRDDVISAISVIVNQDKWGHVLHLSALTHPTREQYYTDAARAFDLPAPEFDEDAIIQPHGKWVDATHTLSLLNFELQYPDPQSMLPQQN